MPLAGSGCTRVPAAARYTTGCAPGRLCRTAAYLIAAAFALTAGGCSFSYQLGSLLGKDKADEQPEVTGSISPADTAVPPSTTAPTTSSTEPSAADLTLAKAAAAEAVGRSGDDVSVPWENPQTGARGTITPLATAYTQNGPICRDFLSIYVRGADEAWLQGEACRVHAGKWEVRTLTALRHS